MSKDWIDFKALKRDVPIARVLERYGWLSGLKEKSPGRLVGSCPIHHGATNPSSFSVDLNKGIWHCFSCGSGGNVLDLVMKAEGTDDIREAAELLVAWFDLKYERAKKGTGYPENSAKVSPKTDTDEASGATATPINPPLARPLQNLNQHHPYLVRRRLTVPTIQYFQPLGMCSRGLMQGRVAVGLHDEHGALVAYAGRAVSEELAREKGKWKLPGGGFKKSLLLFNLNRAKEHAHNGLILVEGFLDAMLVWQSGYDPATKESAFANVVALMGCTLSEYQEQLLVKYTDRAIVMLDGDEAGREGERTIYRRLRTKMFLKSVHLADGEQPDNLSEDRIRELLS